MSDATPTAAADLRAEVEAVNASRGTIISFVYDPKVQHPDDYRNVEPITFIAISNGENWGVTDATGDGNFASRRYGHANFIKFLASPEVISATTLVEGEAFKP